VLVKISSSIIFIGADVEHNIMRNSMAFGKTKVHGRVLHWCKELSQDLLESFDIIVAADW
jgi:hypothetical protein